MIKIKMADFVIEIDNRHTFIEKMCKDYLTSDEGADFSFVITEEDIEKEKKLCEEDFPNGYIEAICAYRKIAEAIIEHDAFLMHGAVIEMDGRAYAFLAKSGTGKSTHIALWRKALGEKVHIINGDKPIFRYINGDLFAYGTPWCGKEGWHKNTSAKLKAICFLERGEENSIEPISPSDSSGRMLRQILMPSEPQGAIKTLELVDRMLKDVPLWLLKCNISEESAILAFNTMSK
jgi:hypothetical protein